MQTIPCVPCGSSPQITDVPGPVGSNAWAIVTSTITLPAAGGNVTVSVNSSSGFTVNQNVYIGSQTSGGANFLVVAISSSTSLTLQFLGFSGDVTTTLPINSLVLPGTGNMVTAGQTLLNGAYTVISAWGAVIPAIGSNVTVTVINSAGFVVGQNVYVATATATGGNFLVYSINAGTTSITLTFLGFPGDFAPGSTGPVNSLMVPGIGGQTNIGSISGIINNNGVLTFTNGIASSKGNGSAPVTISFPATTISWANSTSNNIEVYVNAPGSCISSLSKNGVAIFPNASPGYTFQLQPGETFTPTYASGSPTAKYSFM